MNVEEAIHELNAHFSCSNCCHLKALGCNENGNCYDAVDTLIYYLEWKDVNESLPEDNVPVIIIYDLLGVKTHAIAYHRQCGWWSTDEETYYENVLMWKEIA